MGSGSAEQQTWEHDASASGNVEGLPKPEVWLASRRQCSTRINDNV